MNIGMVRYVSGRILLVVAFLMLPSLLVSLAYRESLRLTLSFFWCILITGAAGFLLSFDRPKEDQFYAREGMVIAALAWILLSVFGSLPFLFSGVVSSPIDAFFETASGFTTTGSSVITNVEALPNSILFWRSFTHLIGGMGVLVFAMAVMPRVKGEDVHIMRAEVPGPAFGKVRATVRETARILYIIYLSMTAILIILLRLGGMDWFESSLHAFAAAGTGGFGIKNDSVGYYSSSYIHNVLAVGMLLFGVNFNLYYLILLGKFRQGLKSEELRWYAGIIAGAVILICLNILPMYDDLLLMVRDVFFTVSSIITTTGFSTVDYGQWPLFSHLILLVLMFFGAMAGSTGGGLKISRVAVYIKTTAQSVRKAASPNRAIPVKFEGKSLSDEQRKNFSQYLFVYIICFAFLLLIVSLENNDFISTFSAVSANFNNIGPGLGVVGPTANYASMNDLSKIALSFSMLTGRLEIFPILVLFSPRTWRRI